MTEATEFMVWRRALAETGARLAGLCAGAPPGARAVVEAMIRHDGIATARLASLLGVATPEAAAEGAGVEGFRAGRRRLLDLLARVDATSLHREMRLPSGKTLDPWRMAGELAELDVRHLAELRRLIASEVSAGG